MHHTWKGIYMKFRGCDEENKARISNIVYENIYMDKPEEFSIWIGPAHQSNSSQLCAAVDGCSMCWPRLAHILPQATCSGQDNCKYENILLRNITIDNPQFSYGQGVILATENTPMESVIFDGVKVINAKNEGVASYTKCEGVTNGVAVGDTLPVPPCFEDQTDSNAITEVV